MVSSMLHAAPAATHTLTDTCSCWPPPCSPGSTPAHRARRRCLTKACCWCVWMRAMQQGCAARTCMLACMHVRCSCRLLLLMLGVGMPPPPPLRLRCCNSHAHGHYHAQSYNFNGPEAQRAFEAGLAEDAAAPMLHWGVVHSLGAWGRSALQHCQTAASRSQRAPGIKGTHAFTAPCPHCCCASLLRHACQQRRTPTRSGRSLQLTIHSPS